MDKISILECSTGAYFGSQIRFIKAIYSSYEIPNIDPSIDAYESTHADCYFKPLTATWYVHEINILRECLFMLSGNSGPIFAWNKTSFSFKVHRS